jgi:hypothetical protein
LGGQQLKQAWQLAADALQHPQQLLLPLHLRRQRLQRSPADTGHAQQLAHALGSLQVVTGRLCCCSSSCCLINASEKCTLWQAVGHCRWCCGGNQLCTSWRQQPLASCHVTLLYRHQDANHMLPGGGCLLIQHKVLYQGPL